MSNLLAEVAQAVHQQSLLAPGQKVLLAVSGGLDSMVLLHTLHVLGKRPENAWEIAVAHFNHQLRGAESDGDEQFVRKHAAAWGVSCHVECGDISQLMHERGWSLEMAARHLRHSFLARTARLLRAVIATGHHADDQVELFFLRLLRGAGPGALAGMRWKNPAPADPEIEVVRPLLGHTREALVQFATQTGIPFRDDSSNARVDVLRNRIRHELLPQLRAQYQSSLNELVLRQMTLLGADDDCLRAQVKELAGQGEAFEFESVAPALQRRLVIMRLRELGFEPDFELVERLRLHTGQAVTVVPGVRVARHDNGMLEVTSPRDLTFNQEMQAVRLDCSHGQTEFGGLKVSWKVDTLAEQPRGSGPDCEWFDADKVGKSITLRHWQAGDRFQPIGSPSPAKLQDLFTNLKLARDQRRQAVVAITEQGVVWWVEGLRMAEQFKVSDRTCHSLRWDWRRGTDGKQ